jgi:membrane fusion protein (multidrug efflux system)
MKTIVKLLLFIGFIAVCAVGAVVARNNMRNGQANGAAKEPGPSDKPTTATQRVRVCVETVRAQPMVDPLILPASVEAWEDIDLSARLGGTVEWIGPKEGDRVSSGEVIMRLDTESLAARVAQARAQLDQARKSFERTQRLTRDRVLTAAELDDATAARDVADAVLEVARVELRNATLKSPIDGIIDRIHFDRGEHVKMGDAVAKIVQIDKVKVVVNVPEKDIRYFREGQDAGVFVGDIRLNEMIRAKIFYVSVNADPLSRTFRMDIEVDNADRRLRPGMIVRVGLIRKQVPDALAVPLFAIVDRGDEKVVFVEKNGRAEQRVIKYGIIDRNRVQITQGLQEGDRLICVGHRDLVDDEPVEVVDRDVAAQEGLLP